MREGTQYFKTFLKSPIHTTNINVSPIGNASGVRCEKASRYVRSIGVTDDIFQLYGGIHSYQEAFPGDGSFFHGKNFVFDPRIAVPSAER